MSAVEADMEKTTIKDVFIGRSRELEQLDQQISAHPLLAVHLHGIGGVGKTKLVQTILQHSSGDEHTIPVYIDFDDIRNRSIETFEEIIAHISGSQEYQAIRQEYQALEKSGLLENQPGLKEVLRERILRCLRPPKGRSLLLIFDTFERVEERLDKSGFLDELFEWLRNDLAQIDKQEQVDHPSIHVIFSGRSFASAADRTDIQSRIRQLFGRDNFFNLKLQPFSGEEIGEYFTAVDALVLDGYLGMFLSFDKPAVIKKLEILSEGKPIFLGLVATLIAYQKENWSGNSILKRTLQDLRLCKTRCRNEFQRSLLTGLQSLGNDVSYAILYMSIMKDFPATEPALWQKLLSLSRSNASALLDELSRLFFIRDNFTLHDELIRLIRRHLWQEMAPLRAHILPLLVEATEEQMKARMEDKKEAAAAWEFTQWDEELQAYEFQVLYYKLQTITRRTSPQQDALNRFKELRDRIQNITSLRRLLEIVTDKLYWKFLSPEFQGEVVTLQNRILNFEGERQQLRNPSPALGADGRIAALCTLAYSQLSENPAEALSSYQAALQLARQENITARLAEVHNYLGMTSRRLNLYDQAVEHYNESIRLYEELGNLSEKAASENNLAYVYRMKGEYDIAFHYARSAFTTREEINDPVGLAYSNQTLGELYRDREELEMAKRFFTAAKQIFASQGMDQHVAQVNIALANIARKQHFPSLVEDLLKESLKTFERLNDQAGLADAQNEYGCELRKRGHELSRTQKEHRKADQVFRRSEQRFFSSIEAAVKTSNWYRLTDSLSDLALLYMYWYENSNRDRLYLLKAQDTAYRAVSLSRRHDMILPESRALEALGNIFYYAEGRYFKAFAQFYLPACLLLAEYQGRSVWRYHKIFDRVHRRMLNKEIPKGLIAYTASYMAERWVAEGKAEIAPGFLSILNIMAGSGK